MESGSEATRSVAAGGVAVLGGDAIWPVARILRSGGVPVLDGEPAPKQVEPGLAARYGFGAGSVRAGALGNPRLIAQLLARAVDGDRAGSGGFVWTDTDGRPRDALRADVEPAAETATEVEANHHAHLAAVRAVIAQSEVVVLPLREVALVEDATGTLFPEPVAGLQPPKAAKVKAAARKAGVMDRAMDEIVALVARMRPGAKIRLVVVEGAATAAPLRAFAAACAARIDGVLYHPLVDELLLRARDEGEAGRYAAALGRVIGALDPVDALVSAAPAPMAQTDEASARAKERGKDKDDVRDARDRRARKEARARRRGRAGAEARVVCEDELLEAFS
jgi:hypothetical protein